jgi:hypothetical protein
MTLAEINTLMKGNDIFCFSILNSHNQSIIKKILESK